MDCQIFFGLKQSKAQRPENKGKQGSQQTNEAGSTLFCPKQAQLFIPQKKPIRRGDAPPLGRQRSKLGYGGVSIFSSSEIAEGGQELQFGGRRTCKYAPSIITENNSCGTCLR